MQVVDLEKIKAAEQAYFDDCRSLQDRYADFDFGRCLPRASFPKAFADFYASDAFRNPDNPDAENFSADFGDGPQTFMFGCLFSPDQMTMQNGIISESVYAPEGSTILPPGHYVIGDAFGANEMRLLINLEAGGADFGKIYLWTLSPDPLGVETNTGKLAFVADDIATFWATLEEP